MSRLLLMLGGDVDLSPYVQDFSMQMGWGEPLSWNATFQHRVRSLATIPSPLVPPGSGDFAGLILPHKMDQSRFIDLEVQQLGENIEFPRLLAKDPETDGKTLNWGGTDLSPLFEQDGKFLPDVLLDGGGVRRFAHEAIAEEASLVGVRSRCEFPNFELRELRRGTGTPAGRCGTIAEVYQAARSWQGRDTVVYEAAQFDPDSSAYDWTIVDRQAITDCKIRSNADGIRNSFEIARQEPQSRLLGEQELRSPAVVTGRTGNIPLSRPCRSIVIRGESVGGDLFGATGYNEAGQVSAFSAGQLGPMIALNGPIARVEFNFKHIPTPAPIPLGFYVAVYGGSTKNGGEFNFPVSDPDNIAQIGLRKEVQAMEVTLPPDGATAQAMALAVLEERIRRTWEITVTTPILNWKMRPGQRLRVVDWLTGGTRVWFIRQVRWNQPANGADTMTVIGNRPWI